MRFLGTLKVSQIHINSQKCSNTELIQREELLKNHSSITTAPLLFNASLLFTNQLPLKLYETLVLHYKKLLMNTQARNLNYNTTISSRAIHFVSVRASLSVCAMHALVALKMQFPSDWNYVKYFFCQINNYFSHS